MTSSNPCRYSSFLLTLTLLTVSSLFSVVHCDIYDLEPINIIAGRPVIRRVVAMYASDDAPLSFSSGNGASSIELELTFNASDGTVDLENVEARSDSLRFVEIVHIAATNLNGIGYYDSSRNSVSDDQVPFSYCCTRELIEQNHCKTEGRLIINADNNTYTSVVVPFAPGASSATLNMSASHFDVTHTSEHLFLVGYCSPLVGKEFMTFSGTGYWLNAYGWLPGRLYGFLPFYGYMMIAYSLLCALWFGLYCRHRTEIAPVQQIISAVLVLSTVEMASWFGDYYSFNVVGRRHVGIVTVSILLTVTRLTLARVLVVAVSLGYGVTIPRLGSNLIRLLCIGVLYWAFECSLELVTRYSQTNVLAEEWRIGLSLPVAVLNALFYWWIFVSLQGTMDTLRLDQQSHKLAIYRQFTGVLIFSLIAAVIFAFYQIYFMTTHQFPIHWSYLWLLDGGFSSFLYSLILIMIMTMWRPTEDSQKYAYSELPINQNDDMDENEFGDLELGTFDENEHHDGDRRAHSNAPDTAPAANEDLDDHPNEQKHKIAKFTVDE